MSAHLYIEGGAIGQGSKEDQIRCREGFRKLVERAGFAGRMPRLSACGGRNSAYEDFQTAHAHRRPGDFIALMVDSEDVPANLEKAWDHLRTRDGWGRPDGAEDDQVLFMTTCMETWIAADRTALRKHYGHKLQENALPPLQNLESRHRHDVHEKLAHATRLCGNAYEKGKRSFDVLSELDPDALAQLPSFVRCRRILTEKLLGQ